MLGNRARRHSADRTESVSPSAWTFRRTFHIRQNVVPRWNRIHVFVILYGPLLRGPVDLAEIIYAPGHRRDASFAVSPIWHCKGNEDETGDDESQRRGNPVTLILHRRKSATRVPSRLKLTVNQCSDDMLSAFK